MSQAGRNRQSAKERVAAQRAAARRAEIRHRIYLAGGSVVIVIAVVAAFFIIKASQGTPTSPAGSPLGTTLPASVTNQVRNVPASTLAAVGGGSVTAGPVKAISGAPLTQNGKPEMLYIGAEFCPYCAELRWSMATALGRFGAFTTPLRGIHSSATDVYPNTATLTFYKTSYSSRYLAFTPVENENVNHAPLQPATREQQAIWNKYDANSFPFIDFGNKYVITSPIYDPAVLQGQTWAQIAAALHNPASPIAKGADGAANYITAAICRMTAGQPASVCATSTIRALEAKL
jgi:thiol-disulfide isomerase/thioredoxin